MFAENDLERVRTETPGLGQYVHLDNCGSAIMPEAVVTAMKAYFEQEIQLGGYVAQEQQSEKLQDVYRSLTGLFGGSVSDYALQGGAVDAWSKAFYSVPMRAGDNIVTMYNDYCSNYVACLQRAKRESVEIRVARAKEDGGLDLDHLESLIDSRTRLVSITHVPSSSGQIADVQAIGRILKQHDALYFLDACQSVGQLPVNFEDIGCDVATATSRKFLRGPRGVGFLYINEQTRQAIDPIMLTNQSASWVADNEYDLREDATVFEMWERSCMLQIGFGAALDYFLKLGPEKATARTQELASQLRNALYNIRGVIPACQPEASAAIITFNKEGRAPGQVKSMLAEQGISVQVASVYHTRLDMGARGIDAAVRVSPHYYNTHEEFARFLEVLESL